MADLSITASSVQPGANAVLRTMTAGEAITVGQAVYQQADGTVWRTDTDTAAKAAAIGIAVSGASAAGQRVVVDISDDDFTVGATVAVGSAYVVSATAGGIAPEADLTTGDYSTFLLFGKSTTKAILRPLATSGTHA